MRMFVLLLFFFVVFGVTKVIYDTKSLHALKTEEGIVPLYRHLVDFLHLQ